MDAGEEQNTGTTNGTPPTSGNSRAPQIAHMSLYERQAVQVGVVIESFYGQHSRQQSGFQMTQQRDRKKLNKTIKIMTLSTSLL